MKNTTEEVRATKRNADSLLFPKPVRHTGIVLSEILQPSILGQARPLYFQS